MTFNLTSQTESKLLTIPIHHCRVSLASFYMLIFKKLMAKNGPIILVENDPDDQEVFKLALEGLKVANKLLYFPEGKRVVDYLKTTEERPFMLICNVHLKGMDGIELRNTIDKDPQLKEKAIPFIFYTTDDRKEMVKEAFEIPVQGYFCKEDTIDRVQELLGMLVKYWTLCKHPNA